MEHRDRAADFLAILLLALFLTACAGLGTPIGPDASTRSPAPTLALLPPSPPVQPASTDIAARPSPSSPAAPASLTPDSTATTPAFVATAAPASTATAAPSATLSPVPTSTSATSIQPNPLDVSVQIDAGRAISQVIPSAGGTLSATALDGTRFTLIIPNRALLRDTTITLTPATLANQLPGGAWSAAVQMLPEGLVLMQPVTLTIQIPNAIPAAGLMGMSYHGAGAGLHLYPWMSNGAGLSVPVMHFSGYGIGQGLTALVRDHVPSTSEDRAEQELARLIGDSGGRAAALDDAARARAGAIFHQWFQELQSEKGAARGDAAATARVLASSRAWSGLLTLMLGAGGRDQNANDLNQSAKEDIDLTIFDLTTLYTLCQRGGGLSIIVLMIDDWKELAWTISPDRASELARLLDLVDKCATLRLSFKSEVHGTTARGGSIVTQVAATVPLTLAPDLNSFQGEGPLAYRTFTLAPNPPNKNCGPWAFAPQGSTFRVLSLNLLPGMEIGSVGSISVRIDPGEPREIARAVCRGQVVPWSTSAWKAAFSGYHGLVGERGPGGYVILDFDVRRTEALYERSWPTMSSDAGSVTETDSILITHAPQQ